MKEPYGFLIFGFACLLIIAILSSCTAPPEPDWGKITHVMKEKGL